MNIDSTLIDATLDAALEEFKGSGRIVIVGASLAGLRAAETLREEGFRGHLTIIGDEPYEPYDRPPLSKQVLKGGVPADHTKLPRRRAIDAEWRLGEAATGLDRSTKQVRLANGEQVRYDLLLIATGVRARPWFNPAEAALDGVFSIRTRDDAARLRERLAAGPRRVLIVGAGFIGSEVASICRELGLAVTVAERAEAPLVGPLGRVIGRIAAEMQRDHGVDLRTGVSVRSLEGDANGRLRSASLSDESTLEVNVVVAALGSIRNVEWLEGSGLAAGPWGVGCDAGGRAFDINGVVTDSVYVAGDVARAPHVLYEYQFLAMEHWDNAVPRRPGRGPQHGEPRVRPLPASAAARLLVGPVRRQHQVRRRAALRRRDRLHAGLRREPVLRRRLRSPRPHRRRRHLRSRQVAGVLRGADRAVGSVPAPAAGLGSARRHDTDPGRVPGAGRPDGDTRGRLDRPRPERAEGRVPAPAALTRPSGRSPTVQQEGEKHHG